MVCGLVVKVMLSAAADLLDLPPRQPRLEEGLPEDFVRQLRLIFLGASAWRDDLARAAPAGAGAADRKR